MSCEEEYEFFRSTIIALANLGEAAKDVPDRYVDLIEKRLVAWNAVVGNVAPSYVEAELARARALKLYPKRAIRLAPRLAGPNTMIPHLSLKVDFSEEKALVNLTLITFFLDKTDQSTLRSLSMRFEQPEDQRGTGGGQHDFYHAQFTPMLDRTVSVPSHPTWLPDSDLCFAIDARNTSELLLACLIHVYSAEIINDLGNAVPAVFKCASGMRLGEFWFGNAANAAARRKPA